MKKKVVCILIILLLCLSIAPFVIAKKPIKPDDDHVSSKQSVLSGDFVAGPTSGQWNSYKWKVLYAYASNIPNSPGGSIKIYDVSDRFATGTENERNILEWDTHGEDVTMKNARGKYVRGPQIKPGTYYYPDSDFLSSLSISIKLQGVTDSYDDTVRLLSIQLSTANFDDEDKITIEVTKTTITYTGSGIPFNYYDWSKIITNSDGSPGPGNLGIRMDHDFEITIDK